MKFFKTLLSLTIIVVSLYSTTSCERDDICAEDTATTPLLIIEFIDNVTKLDPKQPTDLEIRSTDPNVTDSIPDVVSKQLIMIPLKTDSTITELNFIINARNDDPTLVNSDTIIFQYTTEQEYVSSACGFRVNYLDISETLTPDTDNWIQDIEIKKENVTDETSTHILIYH